MVRITSYRVMTTLMLLFIGLGGCSSASLSRKPAAQQMDFDPWAMVNEYKAWEQKPDLSPVAQAICLRSHLADMDMNNPRPKFSKNIRQDIENLRANLEMQLDNLEDFPAVRKAEMEYLTETYPPTGQRTDIAWTVYLGAIWHFACSGELRQGTVDSLLHLVLAGKDEDVVGKAKRFFRGNITAVALQALGDLRNPDILMEIVKRCPENIAKDDESGYAVRVFVGRDWDVLEGDKRTKLLSNLERFRHKLVWQGTSVSGKPGGGSENYPREEEGEEGHSFFRLSWPAVIVDADVWFENGKFVKPLTEEQKRTLSDFERLSPEAQKSLVKKKIVSHRD